MHILFSSYTKYIYEMKHFFVYLLMHANKIYLKYRILLNSAITWKKNHLTHWLKKYQK
jgi:hypothetical protein